MPVKSFCFVHAADIHLDSPLRGLGARPDHGPDTHDADAITHIRSATREALKNLVDQTLAQQADFMVIAGDLYDGDWRDFHTGLFFVAQMGRLAQAGIPVFVLHGNHDAASRITRDLRLPENVRVFPAQHAGTFVLEQAGVALHGQSFHQQAVLDNLVPGYPPPKRGLFNIGVLHTALGGAAEHDRYAPCSLDELVAKGYDYWALGHVHAAQVLHEDPYVVFPGNLQGRHIRELGPKGACLVRVEDGRVTELTNLYCDVVRWSRLDIPVGTCGGIADVVDAMHRALVQATDDADERLLACRVELTGATPLHGELLGSIRQLTAEAQAAALGRGAAVWIERVLVSTRAPDDAGTPADLPDALGELQGLLAGAATDEDLLRQFESDIGELMGRLPAELRTADDDPVFDAAVRRDYARLITLARETLGTGLASPGTHP